MASAVLRDQQSMNGFGKSPSPAQLKSMASEEDDVVRRKSRPKREREGEPVQHSTPRTGRIGVIFKDSRTNLILKQVFCQLRMKDVQEVERELVRLSARSPEDGKVVKNVSRLIVELITETEQISLNLETFSQQDGWNLHAGNVYTEFSKVAIDTFKSAVNWGRIIMFLGFAVSFTVYLEEDIMLGSTESVLQWTCQVVEEDLGEFMSSHGGWVSGRAGAGLASYVALHV